MLNILLLANHYLGELTYLLHSPLLAVGNVVFIICFFKFLGPNRFKAIKQIAKIINKDYFCIYYVCKAVMERDIMMYMKLNTELTRESLSRPG